MIGPLDYPSGEYAQEAFDRDFNAMLDEEDKGEEYEDL